MSQEPNVMVTIQSARKIPFINKNGPITSPISLSRTIVQNLKTMGFQVTEHDEVIVNQHGHRVLVEEFKAVSTVEEIASLPATEIPTAFVQTEEVTIAEQAIITPVVEEDKVEESSKEETTTEISDEETTESDESTDEGTEGDESEELEVYSEEVYAGWSVKLLRNYLRKCESILPEEVFAVINTANKNDLLAIVKEHILTAV